MKRTTTEAGRKAEAELREFALGFPETHEDFPWGHVAIKVKKKVFLFLGGSEHGGLSLSVKLGSSHTSALDNAFASPTPYGLGKHGWVSARFDADEKPPLELLRAWIDESYRAIAPKKLVAAMSSAAAAPATRHAVARDAAIPVARPAKKKATSRGAHERDETVSSAATSSMKQKATGRDARKGSKAVASAGAMTMEKRAPRGAKKRGAAASSVTASTTKKAAARGTKQRSTAREPK